MGGTTRVQGYNRWELKTPSGFRRLLPSREFKGFFGTRSNAVRGELRLRRAQGTGVRVLLSGAVRLAFACGCRPQRGVCAAAATKRGGQTSLPVPGGARPE